MSGLPRVRMCGWCGKALGLVSDRRLPPGEHAAKIEVTHDMCSDCEKKFKDQMDKSGLSAPGIGGVNQPDAVKRDDRKTGGNKSP
jgi:hypothetical protein